MREVAINLPAGAADKDVVYAIDAASREVGLRQVSKGSLGKYPGSVHWHYKSGDQPGTLEITYWPKQGRAWFALRANRRAPWMDAAVPQLKLNIERWLISTRSQVRA